MQHHCKNDRCHSLTLLSIMAIILVFQSLAVAQTNPINRPYQPVILDSSFSEFSAAPINQLFLYKYISASNSWEQIPFQFNEVEPDPSPTDPNRKTYFGTGDGNLDDLDELAFMVRDAGDKAPTNTWVNDASSRTFARYEIALADPLATGNAGYVYLFRSATVTVPPTIKDYVTYVPPPANSGQDTVRGQSYVEGHRSNGINNSLLVPVSAGGSGVDFLDQLKVRFQLLLFGAPIPITEELFALQGIRLRDGKVRLIRELQERISVFTTNLDFAIGIQYFGYSSVLSTDLNITVDGVNLLRQSIDFESNVSGAKWYNQIVTTPITINGNAGSLSAAQAAVVNAPNLNWYMLSSSHGSFINIFSLPAGLGSSQKFYFHDAQSNTGDGTPDSGPGMGSYGDSGLMITGTNIKGRFAVNVTSYMLGKDQDRSVGETLHKQSSTTLVVQTKSQRATVAVEENPNLAPQQFVLQQNSPNPISASTPSTIIRYELPFTANTPVSLRIFNVLGQNVRELVNATQPAGRYDVQWDGRLENGERAPAGIYFYQLRAGHQVATQKLMLLNR